MFNSDHYICGDSLRSLWDQANTQQVNPTGTAGFLPLILNCKLLAGSSENSLVWEMVKCV